MDIYSIVTGAAITASVYFLFKEGWVSFLAGSVSSLFSEIARKSNPEN